MVMPLSDLAELEELLPTNSPELGTGVIAFEWGAAAELRGRWALGEWKNEDILGGETAGEAEIVGSLVELGACKIAKQMTINKAAQDFVSVAMGSWES